MSTVHETGRAQIHKRNRQAAVAPLWLVGGSKAPPPRTPAPCRPALCAAPASHWAIAIASNTLSDTSYYKTVCSLISPCIQIDVIGAALPLSQCPPFSLCGSSFSCFPFYRPRCCRRFYRESGAESDRERNAIVPFRFVLVLLSCWVLAACCSICFALRCD